MIMMIKITRIRWTCINYYITSLHKKIKIAIHLKYCVYWGLLQNFQLQLHQPANQCNFECNSFPNSCCLVPSDFAVKFQTVYQDWYILIYLFLFIITGLFIKFSDFITYHALFLLSLSLLTINTTIFLIHTPGVSLVN